MAEDTCFSLRIKPNRTDRLIRILAYGDRMRDHAGRVQLNVEVRQGGKVIFPKGQLYCSLHGASDSIQARELVMSLVSMKPGDTDSEYFEDYTQDQLDWARTYGEDLNMIRDSRYCDPETGNVRS